MNKSEYESIIDACVANAFDYKSDPRRGAVRLRDLRLILKDHLDKKKKETTK